MELPAQITQIFSLLHKSVSNNIPNDVVFLFFGCVREEKPSRVMLYVCDFSGSEAHWQNPKRVTSMATAIFSCTAVYSCFFLFPSF